GIDIRRRRPMMEQRFEVHEDRILAGRNQILLVEVGGLHRVEEREEAALPLVEPFDLLGRLAFGSRDELAPAVPPAAETRRRPERRLETARAQPRDGLVEVDADVPEPRLEDEAEAGLARHYL